MTESIKKVRGTIQSMEKEVSKLEQSLEEHKIVERRSAINMEDGKSPRGGSQTQLGCAS